MIVIGELVVKKAFFFLALCLPIVSLAACSEEPPLPPMKAHPETSAADVGEKAAVKPGVSMSGKVVETMNSGGYTYVQVDTGKEKVWAAAPEFKTKVGEQVDLPDGVPMQNFHSNTLNRDFPVIYFVTSVGDRASGAAAKGGESAAGHPPAAAASAPPKVDLKGIAKAKGGVTVGELYADKSKLSGKEVTLRGKVVKFNPQIMSKNWLHVRDGSGDDAAHTNDLTVTTNVNAKVGDTVLVNGKVTLDKDFGYGYKYGVILEDAKVTVEK
jgi:hypothetical protein